MKKKYTRSSPMQVQFWVNKGMTEDEAKTKIKSFRKLNTEYWTTRGHSVESALLEVANFQKAQGKKWAKKRANNPDKYKHLFSNTLEYWINKGYSPEEAAERLHDRQSTFSLDKCVMKYGEVKGKKIFNERQTKWQSTLNDKPLSEIEKINKSKDCVSIDFFIKKCGNIEDAKLLHRDAILKRMVKFSRTSKESLMIFKPLYKKLLTSGVSTNDIFFGYKDKKEWYIYSNTHKRIFFYDFVIRSKKIIIEYNGSKFHYNKDIHDDNWRCLFSHQTPEESMKIDNIKKQVAEENGFTVFYLWDFEKTDNTVNELYNMINI